MTLGTSELIWALLIAVILGGSLAVVFWKQRKDAREALNRKKDPAKTTTQGVSPLHLQLQAYERLILLIERISLTNLINRVNAGGLSAREMQSLLVETIRQEFDHNVTQQLYVTAEAWEAVRNLKEQNIFIINQVASFLSENATATELNKHILEMLMQNPKASLHGVVAEVLSYEAKKLMQ